MDHPERPRPRFTSEQKLSLAGELFVALTSPAVRRALGPHGLTKAELALGLGLLERALQIREEPVDYPALPPELSETLEEIRRRWTGAAQAALGERYPELADFVIRGSSRNGAIETRFYLLRFIGRMLGLTAAVEEFGADGARARDLLERAGVTEGEARRVQEMLLPYVTGGRRAAADPEAVLRHQADVEALWRWCGTWRRVADRVIHNRLLRRELRLDPRPGDGSEAAAGSRPRPPRHLLN